MEMDSECSTGGSPVQHHHDSLPSHSPHILTLYAWVITRVLRRGDNNSTNSLICTAAVIEDMGTSLDPTQ